MRALRRSFRLGAAAIAAALMVAVPAAAGTGVITTKADEYDPAASASYVVWSVAANHRYTVYAKGIGGSRFRVNARGTDARTGGIDTDGTTLIYQQYNQAKHHSDIYAYDLATKQRTKIGKPVSTRRWEYGATGSGGWILFARDRSGTRTLLLYNTSTHEMRHLAAVTGHGHLLSPGQVAGAYAVWATAVWKSDHYASCNVFLYDITTDATSRVANPHDRCQTAASVNPAGTVYLGRSGMRCGKNAVLRKQPLVGAATTLVNFADGHDIYSTYALDNGDTTTDVYYDPWRCGTQANVVKLTDP
jgi:hypothetical protein